MEGVVRLKPCDVVDLSNVNTSNDCTAMAAVPDTVLALEDLVASWCKQIEQVLNIAHFGSRKMK